MALVVAKRAIEMTSVRKSCSENNHTAADTKWNLQKFFSKQASQRH